MTNVEVTCEPTFWPINLALGKLLSLGWSTFEWMKIVELLAMVVITIGTALGGLRRLITIVIPRQAKRVGEGEVGRHSLIIVERIVKL